MNDLSPETHDSLDKTAYANSLISFASVESNGADILNHVLIGCVTAYANIWPVDSTKIDVDTCRNLLASRPDIQSLLQIAHADKKYSKIRNLPEFHKTKQNAEKFIKEERRRLTDNCMASKPRFISSRVR